MRKIARILLGSILGMIILIFAGATQAQAHSVTLTWTGSVDSTASYIVFRSAGACPATPGATFAQIGTTATNILTYTDSTVAAGTYCYYVEATLGGVTSVPSNLAAALIKPGAVTVTVTIAQ